MKKAIALILCAVMLLCMLPAMSFAADNSLSFIVATDIHQSPEYASIPYETHNSMDADYKNVFSSGKLVVESTYIFDELLAQAAVSESQYVFITGDLADNGTAAQHQYVAAKLAAFEQSTGKTVFVINGNHDVIATTAAEFKSYYNQFGYNGALSVDADSCSYTADVNGTYRLIAVDTCYPGTAKPGCTDATLNWIKAQVQQAKTDGKKLIGISHQNFIEHYILEDTIHGTALLPSEYGMAAYYADNGVEMNFCGHTHDQDIAEYVSDAGNKFYEVVTGSLASHPCAYRSVKITDNGVKIETKKITSINAAALPQGLTEVAANDVANNFAQYAKKSYYVGTKQTILGIVRGAEICRLLGLTAEDESYTVIFDAVNRLNAALQFPLYTADAAEGETSIEQLAVAYDVKLPDSEYDTVMDVGLALYEAHIIGDENYPAYSAECLLAYRGLAVCLNYALSSLSATDYADVLTLLANKFGFSQYMPSSVAIMIGNAANRFEGLELVLTYALSPVISKFSVDTAPADNNVTLSAYDTQAPAESLSFIDWLKSLWEKFVAFINMYLIFRGKL